MFCPECGVEYVEGIRECADCRVPLVRERPKRREEKPIEFVRMLATYNQGDISVIKSVLDDAGVEYYFADEYFNLVDPLIQPARLFVRKGDASKVRDLLGKMNVTFLGVSAGESGT